MDVRKLAATNLSRANAKISIIGYYNPQDLNNFINNCSSKCDYSTAEYISNLYNLISSKDISKIKDMRNSLDPKAEFSKYAPSFVEYDNIKNSILKEFKPKNYTVDGKNILTFIDTLESSTKDAHDIRNYGRNVCNELEATLAKVNAMRIKMLNAPTTEEYYNDVFNVLNKIFKIISDKTRLAYDVVNILSNIFYDYRNIYLHLASIITDNYNKRIDIGKVFIIQNTRNMNESSLFSNVKFLNEHKTT